MPPTADQIANFLVTRVRPKVRVDGGEMQFEKFEDGTVSIGVYNECAKCPASDKGLKWWIERQLRREFGKELTVNVTRHLRYFQKV
jgi:Fe-S cluster biogenesis protein NfuA